VNMRGASMEVLGIWENLATSVPATLGTGRLKLVQTARGDYH
jgi:hypothetical protein